MEDSLFTFFVMALTALAMENALFFRVLGLNKYVLFLKSPKLGILYGGVFMFVLMTSSLMVSFVNYLLRGSSYIVYVRAPAYFLCATLVYVIAYLLTRRFLPRIFTAVRDILPLSTFNTALFGVFYVSAMNDFNVFQTTGYALGAGLGYTAAILILYHARKRLAMSQVPRSFRGLPILLVYIGLLSLALCGIVGYGIPT